MWICSPLCMMMCSFTNNGLVNLDSLRLHSRVPWILSWRAVEQPLCHSKVILMWICEQFQESGEGNFPGSE